MANREATLRSRSASPPSVSVVVITHNEGERLTRTVHQLLATAPPDAEVVVVDDCSTDASCDALGELFPDVSLVRPKTRQGIAGSRNVGAARTRSRNLVFSDAHIDPLPGWPDALLTALDRPGAGVAAPAVAAIGDPAACGYGMTWRDAARNMTWLPRQAEQPYAVPFAAGMFLACRRDFFDECGGFDEGLEGWGSEDAEFRLRLWTLGHQCLVVPGVQVAHLFRAQFPYTVDPIAITHNMLRMALVHLGRDQLSQVLTALAASPWFAPALAQVIDSDASVHRERLHGKRRRDASQFCREFGIDLLSSDPEEDSP